MNRQVISNLILVKSKSFCFLSLDVVFVFHFLYEVIVCPLTFKIHTPSFCMWLCNMIMTVSYDCEC